MLAKHIKNFGSWAKNIKRLAVIGALLCSGQIGETRAENAHYLMRIHKNFMKDIIDKNFRVILDHIESKVEKNVYLEEINANIDNLDLKILPKSGGEWDKLESDLFFDAGQIVTELSNLEFKGSGLITDPETGVQEDIELRAALDLCQVVLSPEQHVQDGNVYPQIEVAEVAFTLLPNEFIVNAQGELPLYKSRAFEEGIKKWMKKEISKREKEFKLALQKSEREIMKSFAFKQEVSYGTVAHSTLSETMALQGDHITLAFDTTFEGPDLDEAKTQMRAIEPAFSDDGEHMRDVQVVIDENYLNYYLYDLFHNDRTFSVAETLFSWMPEGFMGGGTAIRALLSTSIWSFLFPELKQYKKGSKLDFKCGFNKDYLVQGQLDHAEISQAQFEEGNKVGFDLHFGCNLNVQEGTEERSDVEALLDLFKDFQNAPTAFEEVYVGCYADGGEGKPRMLPEFLGNNKHPQDCFKEAHAKGFKYAGMQAADNCFAANAIAGEKLEESRCSSKCMHDDSLMCGAAWVNSVWRLESQSGNDQAWKVHRSFFTSVHFKFTFDFADDVKSVGSFGGAAKGRVNDGIGSTFGKIVDFYVHIDELKIFEGSNLKSDEAMLINQMLNGGKMLYVGSGAKTLVDTLFSGGLPIAPFPLVEHCLGLSPKDSSMVIKDGYAIMAYDFTVESAQNDCIFDMDLHGDMSHSKKQKRMIDNIKGKIGADSGLLGVVGQIGENLSGIKDSKILKKYKPTIDKIKNKLDEKLEEGVGENYKLPFKIPTFNIGETHFNLNRGDNVNKHLKDVNKVLKSEPVQGVLSFLGLN